MWSEARAERDIGAARVRDGLAGPDAVTGRAAEEEAWEAARALARRVPGGLPHEFEAQARRYLLEIERWTGPGRLTGYPAGAARVRELIGGSLLFLLGVPELGSPLADVGSGPGVPGLILKLARPTWEVTLVESRRRPANFLRQMARVLDLRGLEVVEGRAEATDVGAGLRGRFRAVTLRAVTRPAAAARLARPLMVAEGGIAAIALGAERGAAGVGGLIREVVGTPLLGRRRFLIVAGR